MLKESTPAGRSLEVVPVYLDYQLVRVRPVVARLCMAGVVFLLSLLLWDLTSLSPQRDLAMLCRALAALPLLVVVELIRRRRVDEHLVDLLLTMSLLSFVLMALNFIFLPERTAHLPIVVFYYHLGMLVAAPLISNLHILLFALLPIPLLLMLMSTFGVATEYRNDTVLHTWPLLIFVCYAAWHIRRTAHHQYELFRRNIELATLDGLTQLLNRRAWEQHSLAAHRKAKREETDFAVLILDVDHFKRINDTWGHPAGDDVLRQMARVLRGTLRDYDVLGRFGGEEFVIAVSGLDKRGLMVLAERIRVAVEELRVRLESGQVLQATTSVGVALMSEGDPDMEAVLVRADRALYRAKQHGRNRVEFGASEDSRQPDLLGAP